LINSNTSLQLGGTGVARVFHLAWGLSNNGNSCTFGLTVNGVVQQQLKFGLGGGAEKWYGGAAILSLPDNAVLTLRNLSTTTCGVNASGNGGGGTDAYLTVYAFQ